MTTATASPAVCREKRFELASARAAEAFRRLAQCRFCAWECGSDRSAGPGGHCQAGNAARYFIAQREVSDELELVPTFAIALSGCNLRCAFCITGDKSWNAGAGEPLNLTSIARHAREAIDNGARSIMILGGEPAIHLPHVLAAAATLPDSVPLVLKTNAYLGEEGRELLDGVFDILLPDFKFGNDACARKLAGVENYMEVLKTNLLWASGQPELIIRHVLLPGHLECCWKPIAQWIAAHLPGTRVSLRTAFWPAWKSARHRELLGSPAALEAAEYGRSLGLRLIE